MKYTQPRFTLPAGSSKITQEQWDAAFAPTPTVWTEYKRKPTPRGPEALTAEIYALDAAVVFGIGIGEIASAPRDREPYIPMRDMEITLKGG